MKTIFTTGWNFMRILRVAIGVWALVLAIRDHDMLTGAFVAFILFTGIMNTGCCATGTCSTGYQRPAPGNKHGSGSDDQ